MEGRQRGAVPRGQAGPGGGTHCPALQRSSSRSLPAAPRTEGPPPSAAAGWGRQSRDRRRSVTKIPQEVLGGGVLLPGRHRGAAGRRSAGRSLGSSLLARRGLLPVGPYYCLAMQGAIRPPVSCSTPRIPPQSPAAAAARARSAPAPQSLQRPVPARGSPAPRPGPAPG